MTPTRRLHPWILLALGLGLSACAETPAPPAPKPEAAVTTPVPRPSIPTPPAPPKLVQPMPPSPSALHCDDIVARQDKRDIQPVKGTLTLARRPFALIYTGPGDEPSFYASTVGLLDDSLDQLGVDDLWGAADEYLDHDPEDLPIRESARLITNPEDQDRFLALLGLDYPSFFRQMIVINNEPAILVSAPKAAGGFRKVEGGQAKVVRTIDAQPLTDLRHPVLYLTYFANTMRVGPSSKGNFGNRSLLRMKWGSCRLAFP